MRAKLFYGLLERPLTIEQFGNGNGAWNVYTPSLSSKSFILSAGVGFDISFDLGIGARFGCQVLMLDPSPTGRGTIAKHSPLPANIGFEAVGLSNSDECATFAEPKDLGEGSFSKVSRPLGSGGVRSFPCRRVSTIMSDHKIFRIDLLKIDIEGFEYPVIWDILRNRLPIDQICVEFHHGLVPGITRFMTVQAILGLVLSGYRLCNHEGLNHTFVKTKLNS